MVQPLHSSTRRSVRDGFDPNTIRRQLIAASRVTAGLVDCPAGQPTGSNASPAHPWKRIYYTVLRPNKSETTNSTRNTAKRIFAKPAAMPARPEKPNTAAISAITKNVIVQLNITSPLFPANLQFFAAESSARKARLRVRALHSGTGLIRGGGDV